MSDPAALSQNTENYDDMTAAEFEERLPDLFQTGGGKVTEDPRFAVFLERNPDCAALVRDLEAIASAAVDLFQPAEEDEGPPEPAWGNLANELRSESGSSDEPNPLVE